MPIEKEPVRKVSRTHVSPGSVPYRVKDGDTWISIARAHALDPWDLIEANFATRDAGEVNWYLRDYVGCKVATPDKKNWEFSSSAAPGVIHIPRGTPGLYYVVPNMKLIAQDRTMSCWFASGQMLIEWRSQTRRACEADHPDPSLLAKWHKLYDDNPGISDGQIGDFARDLGLRMVGSVTPSPQYVRELLMAHGPLWVNGNSHITVIAGIRRARGGVEVLVFDPAKPALVHGAWHDFYQQYGLTPHTSLDASAASPTSMLYISSL
ncbi:MAG TPA: papain-like cysteine protease family protein [Candidatus Acidoferrales bacterium]|nr:papain-like cysteine protease family protein [Candidatus Acidoferrales bacterium]